METIVIVAEEPANKVPILAVTVLPILEVNPCEEVAETNCRAFGKISVTTTLLALIVDEVLVTINRYASKFPTGISYKGPFTTIVNVGVKFGVSEKPQ